MEIAIRRERQMKAWKRDWKFEQIEKINPDWVDLHDRVDALEHRDHMNSALPLIVMPAQAGICVYC
jgi:hypothetical protein